MRRSREFGLVLVIYPCLRDAVRQGRGREESFNGAKRPFAALTKWPGSETL